MKILVTGHEGFIASYFLKKLEGHEVIGLDKKSGNDILDCYLPDVDLVIHLAAQISIIDSIKDPMRDAITNIVGTIRLAKKYKDKRFIFISSGGAIQETIESPYGLSKFCGEKYVKLLCKEYVILRLPNIYGKGSTSVVDKFINGDIKINGDGKQTRDYVYVGDIVEAIIDSMKWPVGTYHLGSEENISVLQLAKETGKTPTFFPAIDGELKHSYVHNDAPFWKPKIKVLDYVCANCNPR